MLDLLEDRTLLSFAAPTAFDLAAAPNAVAVGHFEGASAPLDVVSANADGTVSVFLGRGDGTLQNPIDITTGATPSAVAVGDFLGNGLQDIAVANTNGTVTLILSNGNGTFRAPRSFTIGGAPTAIAVGDFNGDGKLDIVTANGDGSVRVLAGNGAGAFGKPIVTHLSGSLTSVAVGDFNGDHRPDLVVGTDTGLDSLVNQGNGTFQLAQTVSFARVIHGITFQESVNSVAVNDLRHNGREDIVALAGGSIFILLGNGDGTFQPRTQLNTGQSVAGSFVLGDFNGDGNVDIVASNDLRYQAGPSITFLGGNGNGTFQAPAEVSFGVSAAALAAGDFRGNGRLDLVMAIQQGTNGVALVQGNGNGTFAIAPSAPTQFLSFSIAAGDFNGDGRPDLVVSGSGSTGVLLNNGNGTFRPGQTLFAGFGGTAVVADFNGDGKQDIAVSTGSGTIDVFLGNGDGTFQAARVFNLGSVFIQNMVAGNFVHGRLPDLAVMTISNNGSQATSITVLLNSGNGTFTRGQTVSVGTDALDLSMADFNHDGNPDLVTTSFLPSGNRNVEVLLGNGNGTFRAPIITTPGLSASFVAAADLNGDGNPDLVLVDYFDTDESVLILQGNGDGTFQPAQVIKFQTPLGFATPAIGDFFGDGRQSIALSDGSGGVILLRGNGDGTFQAPVTTIVDFIGAQPNSMVAADFNGDGKLDLAVTSPSAADVSILLNTSPAPSHAAPVATSVALTSNVATAVFGQSITLTATVTPASTTSGLPTGSVTFFDGTTRLGVAAVDPNGQARLLIQLPPGSHSLTAVFGGILPFNRSTSAAFSETVNKAATTINLSADTHAFGINGFVLLTANVVPVPPGGPGTPTGTGTVTFMEGSTVLGTAQLTGTGQVSLFLERRLGPGTHTVRAIYSGDVDFLGSVATITFTVP
jgi:hypothetical protein